MTLPLPERTLKIPETVRTLIRHLHPEMKRKLRLALNDILTNPACGKPLERELKGYWSLRMGRYRIIYRPDKAGAEIVSIGPRRTIYEEMERARRKDLAGKNSRDK